MNRSDSVRKKSLQPDLALPEVALPGESDDRFSSVQPQPGLQNGAVSDLIPAVAATEPPRGRSSLRRDLMVNVLPWVVLPAGAAALVAYTLAEKQTRQQTEQELQDQVAAVSQSTRDRLSAARKIPKLVAPDPAVVEFSRTISKEVEKLGLHQASNQQVTQQIRQTLQAKSAAMDGNLRRTAQAARLTQLSLTDQHGVYVAGAHSTPELIQRDKDWWKQTKQSGQSTQLVTDAAGMVTSVDLTQAIAEPNTGKFLGAVRGRFSVNDIQQALSVIPLARLATSQQMQVLAYENNQLKPIGTLTADGFTKTSEVLGGGTIAQRVTNLVATPPSPQTTSGAESPVKWVNYQEDGSNTAASRGVMSTFTDSGKLYTVATIPGSNWVAVSSVNPAEVGVNLTWAWAIAAMVFVLATLAAYGMSRVARQWSRVLSELAHAFDKAAAGNLNVQLPTKGSSELQRLTQSFNQLITSIRSQTQQQTEAMKQSQFYTELAQAAGRGDTATVFDLTVQLAKRQLRVDRAVIYCFESDWSGRIVAEAVEGNWARALNDKITDPCIPRATLEEYRQGRYVPTSNVQATNYSPKHLQLLERLQVKANLVVPVVSGDRLLGLLVGHQCSAPRNWSQEDIKFLRELASQVGLALTGTMLAAEKAEEAERARQLNKLTFRMREVLDPDHIYTTALEEIREALKCDRTVVYLFDSNWRGTVVAESVENPWTPALGASIEDPCFISGYVDKYRRGRVHSLANIPESDLDPCYKQQLARFEVKANLVAPILVGDDLKGLLVAHQCSNPRVWQESESNFFRQVAIQLGFALDQARLLQQQQESTRRAQQLNEITSRIRQSLKWEDILNTTVRELRQGLTTDRVIIYRFNPDWSGTIIAESTSGGWKEILGETVNDPFREGLIEMYRNGRVRTMDDVNAEGLTDCHRDILEGFQIRASMTAPILRGDQLLGLLCVHQCDGARKWQPSEVDLFSQLAVQTSYALEQSNLLKQQEEAVRYATRLNEITFRMRESLDRAQIFQVAVRDVRETMTCDRVIVYLFDQDWRGSVMAESVGRGFPVALGAAIADPCFAEDYVEKYRRGRVHALSDIAKAKLDPCYMGQLTPFQVKANIVAPILINGNLLGLLCAHQCSAPRDWQEAEISFLKQAAIQLGFALEQADLFAQKETARLQAEGISEEQRRQKESLQHQLLELLEDVEGAASGDLTVRADVTTGEIGTVADFFNSIVESLRQIVTQVKQSALKVRSSLGENEGAMQQLADEAMQQADETLQTLESVEQMKQLILAAADSARQAAEVAHTASTTAEAGGVAMDSTVQNILNLRETIGETAKKVKRLGESSQQISKVVSLINQIAMQTNLLAINAGIEAARAGEDGHGFAVVAEEVGELAARSATATQEIEQIVDTIQRETTEVVLAMEKGTAQVVEGTHIVTDAKQSLEKILRVSQQIDDLAQSISQSAVSQVETSQSIAQLMEKVAQTAGHTSKSSRTVSNSLRQTVKVAQSLQESVETFKVN